MSDTTSKRLYVWYTREDQVFGGTTKVLLPGTYEVVTAEQLAFALRERPENLDAGTSVHP